MSRRDEAPSTYSTNPHSSRVRAYPSGAYVGAVAILLLLAGLQYVIIEAVVAAVWTDPPYNYATNLVPDLGNSACGPYQDRVVCSPLYPLMNAGFIVQGLLFGAAGVLMSRLLAARARVAMLVLTLVFAVGLILTGVFHHSHAAADGTLALNFV